MKKGLSERFAGYLFFLGIPMIIVGIIISPSVNSGEVPFLIELEQCVHGNKGTFSVFPLRPVVEDEPIGTACPTTYTVASAFNVSMEQEDGYLTSATYLPVVFLRTQSFAQLAFEIVDSNGTTVLPLRELALGPSTTYPWNTESSCTCSYTCAYNGDNACDDGGPDSTYAQCDLGSDCLDCGCRDVSGRRLHDPVGELPIAEQPGREADDEFTPAPGSRRLLKGGSVGSRSGSSGTSRWGSSTPITVRAGSATSGAYTYRYSTAAVQSNSNILVVRRRYYGCYACFYGCLSCRTSNCRSREECNDLQSVDTKANLDRYEIDFSFKTPAEGAVEWPLYLRIQNFTTYSSTTESSISSYMTFYTADGDDSKLFSTILTQGGLIVIVLAIVISCCQCCKKSSTSAAKPRVPRVPPSAPSTSVQPAIPMMPVATPVTVGVPVNANLPTAQPVQGQPPYPCSPPSSPPTASLDDSHDKSL
ncbi:hypothetical protein AB1Y20_004603 [Prymnesium parvum]|uniref:Uncharacterized protein n=1 Tax=Prymnesium parvum TaxID=97485 RepID=A0AB34IXC8_PRYPA